MWPFFNSSVIVITRWYSLINTDGWLFMNACQRIIYWWIVVVLLSQLVESWYLMIFMDKLSPKIYLIDEYSGYWLMVVYHSKSWSDFKSIILAALTPTPAPLEEPSHLQGPPEDQKRWIFTQENEGKTMQFIGHLSVISGVIFLWD